MRRRRTERESDSLPPAPCGCGKPVTVAGRCGICHELYRPLTPRERAVLDDRDQVPPREGGEGTTDYYFRALAHSTPRRATA